ncbi:MAG: hypothetical protein Q9188_007287 [Gyalolechia gomerana]
MVKDFVRVVLEHHGIINPGSNTKPGMVHMTYSHPEAPVADGTNSNLGNKDMEEDVATHGNSCNPKKIRGRTVTAHINLKTHQAALRAWSTMAGHRLWGKPLVAAVFSPADNGMVMRASDKPVNGKEPVDLDQEFTITSPSGEWMWGRNAAGKITKMEIKVKSSRQRQASPEVPSHRKRARKTSPRKGTFSIPPLDEVQEKVHMVPPPTQSPLFGISAGGYYGQYPAWWWVQDYYGRWFPYQQSTWVPFYGSAQIAELEGHVTQEAPANEVKHPIIIDGDISE